jgi:hypothetical protein
MVFNVSYVSLYSTDYFSTYILITAPLWRQSESGSLVMSLPFLTHPRIVRFMASDTDSFERLTCFLNAICSSLQSPATLEDLGFSCEIGLYNLDRRWVDFNDGVWAALDSLVADPLYARLRRVDVTMKVTGYNEVPAVDVEGIEAEFHTILSQKFPLLSSKGILHLRVQVDIDPY